MVGCFPSTSSTILPCSNASTGEALCNPNRRSWPFSNTTDWLSVNLAGWCREGHDGRLCTQCRSGYYPVGRDCVACARSPWQWDLPCLYAFAFLLLIGLLYAETKDVNDSDRDYHADAIDHTRIPATATSAALAILLFHCQQLGLLLSNETSFSQRLTSFVAAVSTASRASLQTSLALECFRDSYGFRERVVASVIIFASLLALLAPGDEPMNPPGTPQAGGDG